MNGSSSTTRRLSPPPPWSSSTVAQFLWHPDLGRLHLWRFFVRHRFSRAQAVLRPTAGGHVLDHRHPTASKVGPPGRERASPAALARWAPASSGHRRSTPCRCSTRSSTRWAIPRWSGLHAVTRGVKPTIAREAGDAEPGQLGQGPDRHPDDRGRRARRTAQAGGDDRRAHVRQHRPRPRDRGGGSGLPLHLRDARQDEPGEDLPAARLRGRGRDLPRPRSRPNPPRATTGWPTGSRARSRAPSSRTSTTTR